VRTQKLTQVLVFGGTRLGSTAWPYQLQKDGVHAAAIHGESRRRNAYRRWPISNPGKTPVLVRPMSPRAAWISRSCGVINFDAPGARKITCTASAARPRRLHRQRHFPGLRRRARKLAATRIHQTAHSADHHPRFRAGRVGVSVLMHTERERPERRPQRGSSLTRGGARAHMGKALAKPPMRFFSAPYVRARWPPWPTGADRIAETRGAR